MDNPQISTVLADTALEKKARRNALLLPKNDDDKPDSISNQDLAFTITIDREAKLGDEMSFTVKMTNLSKTGNARTVRRLDINVFSLVYNEVQRSLVKTIVHRKQLLAYRQGCKYSIQCILLFKPNFCQIFDICTGIRILNKHACMDCHLRGWHLRVIVMIFSLK